jgi:hypothetical protein
MSAEPSIPAQKTTLSRRFRVARTTKVVQVAERQEASWGTRLPGKPRSLRRLLRLRRPDDLRRPGHPLMIRPVSLRRSQIGSLSGHSSPDSQ